ncbi:MAG: helix-turn-helix domain-containing protein [Pseudonocardiaceae bacterium]|nr:helix-turn-helix domain-containing protein [Pseudonocardiaceae bacterium]
MAETGDDSGVRSVLRALDLLALFTEEHARWTIRDLTEASGLAKTTVIRLVTTLERRGLLWSSGTGHITVGPGLLRWSTLARSTWQLPEQARQQMRALSEECGETVNLYVRSNVRRVCVAKHEGAQHLRHVVRVGDELPLWSGAASWVLLADADDELLAAIVADAPAEYTVDVLRAGIAEAANRGYAVSHGERELGASGVAAPVTDARGTVLAALAPGGPTARFTEDNVARFGVAVREAARRMSQTGFGGAG